MIFLVRWYGKRNEDNAARATTGKRFFSDVRRSMPPGSFSNQEMEMADGLLFAMGDIKSIH
jgi:hypothetical protein